MMCRRLMAALLLALGLVALGGCQRLSYFGPDQMYRVADDTILLTFDDGPSPSTGKILDVLRENDIKAAFFLRGDNALRFPELVARIASEGHYVGNHTFDHVWLTRVPFEVGKEEVLQAQAALGEYGSRKWFRPPFGELPYDLAKWLAAEGYTVVRWTSVDSRNLKPGDILLLHDNDDVAEDLPGIIADAERALGRVD